MTFDPALHEYRDGDTIIESVTQILKRAGLIDDRWFSEEARDRGSAVHTLCERYAHGIRFDNTGRPLASLQYVNAFAQFIEDFGAYAIDTETLIYGEINGHRYAGKYDLLAEIKSKRVLIDIKTGAKAKWHPVQLAAYAMQAKPHSAMDLYLKANGTYQASWLTPGQLVDGGRIFKSALMTRRSQE